MQTLWIRREGTHQEIITAEEAARRKQVIEANGSESGDRRTIIERGRTGEK